MIEIGRIYVKIAGRDSNKKCVIVDILEGNFVLIDGETRRRKCNTIHLEPLDETIDIKKNASHDEVVTAFKKLGIEIKAKKPKAKTVRPRKLRRSKLATSKTAPAKEKKVKKVKKIAEKAEKPKAVEKKVVKKE